MTTKFSTKKALLASVLSLVLCFSMLVGTTFAWFTDSVTSANNIIKSGNLDIELDYWDGTDWQPVTENTELIAGDTWEPGHTQIAYFRITNAGSLALKYQFGVNVIGEEKIGKTKPDADGNAQDIKLSEILQFGVLNVNGQDAAFASRADAVAEVEKQNKQMTISDGYAAPGRLAKGAAPVYLALVVYMPTSVGNEANHDGENVPKINLGINVFATQDTVEKDSYDEFYDQDTAVFTVEDANKMLAAGKDVTLVNCYEPEEVLFIPYGYTGTLVLQNVKIASVQESAATSTIAADGEEQTTTQTPVTNIVILGDVTVNATEDGMSAITGTALNISGNGNLVAVANGKHAFGIGGKTTEYINIENVHIVDVKGGYVQPNFINDTKYGKSEPEGGAAIGSGFNGAEINLKNVTIDNAQGGSKAAGIGASFWTGVTINITNSTIKNVEGGNASAGIGGSRVSNGATESGTTINITNSIITATGGQAGAGIGSGYDTHCQAKQPMCTVNITDSTINATGGKYAAGVGSGYHNAALSGEIKNSTVNAVSGEKLYKDTYTQAQDIGFGVVDPAREGQQTDSKLIYNGVEIGIPEVITLTPWKLIDVVTADVTIKNMVAEDYVEILHKSGDLTITNVTFKNGLTIYNEVGSTGTVKLENCTIYLSDGIPANASYNMCKADYGMYVGAISENVTWIFNNCTFTAKDDHAYAGDSGYNVYIAANYNAKSFTFDTCTFEKSAKHGIGCSSDANASYYALTVINCNFKDWNNNATNGAAIRGNLPAADFDASITITGNSFGNNNNSTQNTVQIDSWNGSWN